MKMLKRLTAVLAAGVLVLGMGQVLPEKMVSVSAADVDWRQIYKEKMYEYLKSSEYAEGHGFGIFDLDRDQVPELFISNRTDPFNGPHYARCKIYTVSDGKLLELGSDGCYGWLNVIEGTNYLYSACNQGHSYVRILQKNGDTIETIFEAYTAETGQILGHDDADYIVNGAAASKAVYDTELAEYYDVDNDGMVVSNVGQQYSIDEATIMKIFETTYNFNNNTYQVFDISCSWTEAKEICENLGGNLVSINTAEEQVFIEDLLEEQSKDNYWTGGYRSGSSWRWCDGTAVTYTNWDSWTGSDGTIYAQPDNYTGDEDYIRIASRFIQYDDWLVNAGGWIDTANTADGISSGEAGLHKFGFICEWETPPNPFVQAHLNFIEENPDAFVSAEDVYVLAETKKLMYEYDSEITTYNGLKSFQNLIGGDMDTDTFNAELTAQAILTDLLCSEETLAAMETAAQKAEDAFLIQAPDIFLKNASDFKIDGTDLAELTALCEIEDKSSAEYVLKCKEWIYDFVPTVELELLSTYFDVTGKSGESLLLNVGLDAIETSEKYVDYCIAVKGYNASDACLREALDKLLASLFVEYYMVQNGLDAESIRIKSVVDEFQKYCQSVTNTSDTKYLEYAVSLVGRLDVNTATQAVAAISKELLLTAVSVACPTLGAVLKAMDLAFTIGMNVWEILSNVDERALERDMFLNMLVYYDAIVNAMNQDFENTLVTEKTLDSAYLYEEGFGFYQKITAMMVDHGTQYYSMMYDNISKTGYTEDEFKGMAEHVEGLLGTAYVEKMLAILEDQKGLFVDDEELEMRLRLSLGYVKFDMRASEKNSVKNQSTVV